MSYITLHKNNLAKLVQHLRDAHGLLLDQYLREGICPDPLADYRQNCIDFYVKTFFENTRYPLIIMNDDKNPTPEVQGQNPIWPGDEPKAPAPGTVTVDPKTGETIIVPVVR